jgi:hypothetical protein
MQLKSRPRCQRRRSCQALVALALRGLQSLVSDSAMIDKPERRFPPPRIAEETDACFIVRDAKRIAWSCGHSNNSDSSLRSLHSLRSLR